MTAHSTRRTFLVGTAGFALAAPILPTAGLAQEYPARDITHVVPYAPGSLNDSIARLVADKINKVTGRNVVLDYRPGAGGAIAGNYYVGVRPDGYTLLQTTNAFYSTIPVITKVEFNPKTDFTPLVVVGDAPMVIAVNHTVAAKNLQELITFAKANPDKISYGSAGRGTVGHMCGEWLARKANIRLLHIPYNATPQALQAALSNEVQMVFGPETGELILSGKLKGIAILGGKRWQRLPDLPTTVESGLPGWAPRSWHAVTVLSKAPDDIKARLHKLLNEILQLPDVQTRITNLGLIPAIEDMAQVRKRADDDQAEFGTLIADAGLGIGK